MGAASAGRTPRPILKTVAATMSPWVQKPTPTASEWPLTRQYGRALFSCAWSVADRHSPLFPTERAREGHDYPSRPLRLAGRRGDLEVPTGSPDCPDSVDDECRESGKETDRSCPKAQTQQQRYLTSVQTLGSRCCGSLKSLESQQNHPSKYRIKVPRKAAKTCTCSEQDAG